MKTTTDISRTFVTESIGGTPIGGFTIDRSDEGSWVVSDGQWSESATDPAEALNLFATFIEQSMDDLAEYLAGRAEQELSPTVHYATPDEWRAAADAARADAANLRSESNAN